MKYRRERGRRGGAARRRRDSILPAPSLRRRFLGAAAVAGGAAAAIGLLRTGIAGAGSLPETAIPVAVSVLVLGAVVRQALPALPTHAGDGKNASRLGPAVPITLLRLALVSALGGHALALALFPGSAAAASGFFPFALYLPAVLADALDGAVARRAGRATEFGALLDRETDALGLLAASLAAVLSGALPAWFLAAGAARYLCALGLFVEERLGRRRRGLDPSPFRRRLAGFAMALVAGSLATGLPGGLPAAFAHPAALTLGAPFLIGFARDYAVLSGRLDPVGPRWRAAAAFLARGRRPAFHAGAAVAALFAALTIFVPDAAALGPRAVAAAAFTALLTPARRPGPAS